VNGVQGQLLAGRYRLDEMVGSGGAGNVWAAVDEMLGRRVAVKDVGGPRWIGMEGQEAVRERTMREARAAALIDHPNVVTVYDVLEFHGRPWIVMELVQARTLAQVIEQEGPRRPGEAARIGLQVLAALRAAHAHGILHRDVKPSNVLVTADGRAVLTDFGIATIDGDVALTASGVLVGAPAFIAPERVQQGAVAGPASDLWSLGATLYTAVEGRPPYQRDGAICTIAAVVHDEPDPVERAGRLAPVLAALLRRDPELRPTPAEVHDLLTEVVDRERTALGSRLAGLTTGPTGLGATAAAASTTGPTATGPTELTGPTALVNRAGAARTGPTALVGRADGRSTSSTGRTGPTALDDATGLTTTTTIDPATRRPPRNRARTAALFSAAGLLFTVLVIGILAELTGRPAEVGPAGDRPGVDAPASEQPASDGANDGGGPGRAPGAGNTTESVEPAAEVSSVGDPGPSSGVNPSGVAPTGTSAPDPTTVDPTTPEPTTEPTTTDQETTAETTTGPATP